MTHLQHTDTLTLGRPTMFRKIALTTAASAVMLAPVALAPTAEAAYWTSGGMTVTTGPISVTVNSTTQWHNARALCKAYIGGATWFSWGWEEDANIPSRATCWGGYPIQAAALNGDGEPHRGKVVTVRWL